MSADKEFKIERIVASKGRGARKQHLVKWVGYPAEFNSWVSADSIKRV